MLKRILKTLALSLLLLGMALPARAVSQKEMEQARTITAFWYLRYANNGAGYMEEGKMPATMAELEKMLKETERANLKAFKAVSTPSDYATWDKKKLVAYWSGTFFNSAGLKAEGKVARRRVEGKLNAMTVSAAPAATEQEPAEAAPSETPKPEPAAAEAAPVQPAASAQPAPTEGGAAVDTSVTVEEEPSDRNSRRSGSGSTWIYIVALIVLVGVVVWLVIFASKTMQQSEKKSDDTDSDSEPRRRTSEPKATQPRNETPAADNDEVRALHREIKGLREQCMRLGEENGCLESDLTEARRELDAVRGRLRAAEAMASAASAAPAETVRRDAPAEASRSEAAAVRPEASPERVAPRKVAPVQEEADEPREIYLGRVNPKGLFVRADRRPVADKTVFVLTTTDGYTGSYRVLQMTEVIERCLENPDHYLAGGCTAPDLLATEDAACIRTIQSGTAIFENGCWRMIRKTKIVYE